MIRIRSATIDDCPRITEIQISGWRKAYQGFLPEKLLDEMDFNRHLSIWIRLIQKQHGNLLIAEESGNSTGFCHMIPSRDPDADGIAEITAIYVAPEMWRMGCGSALMKCAIQNAEEQKFNAISLWVLEKNKRGRDFYHSLGFTPDGSEKVKSLPGGDLHEVRYRKLLQIP